MKDCRKETIEEILNIVMDIEPEIDFEWRAWKKLVKILRNKMKASNNDT